MQLVKNTKLLVGENSNRFGSFLVGVKDCVVGTEQVPKDTVVQVVRIHDESKAVIKFKVFDSVCSRNCHISLAPYRFRFAYKNEEKLCKY